MKTATYTAIEFCRVGSCALLKGVQHPDGVGPDVVTTPVQFFAEATGVIETKNTWYIKAVAPSKLYKLSHDVYLEFTRQASAARE